MLKNEDKLSKGFWEWRWTFTSEDFFLRPSLTQFSGPRRCSVRLCGIYKVKFMKYVFHYLEVTHRS